MESPPQHVLSLKTPGCDCEHACYLTSLSLIRKLFNLFGEMWCCLVVTTWILSLRCTVTLRHEYSHSNVLSHKDMNSVTPLCCQITTWILSIHCIVALRQEAVTPLHCHITTWILSLHCIVALGQEAVTPLYCHITTWILSLRCIVTLFHEFCHNYCHLTKWILSLRCIVTWHEFCHSAVLSHYDMNSVTLLYCHITTWILSLRCIVT